MKRVLRDHGQIIHAAGHHSMFPVVGATPAELAFAHHGATEGRKAIGWPTFFPAFDASGKVVVVDDEAGELTLVPEAEAIATLGDAARRPTFLQQARHALGLDHGGGNATPGADAAPK